MKKTISTHIIFFFSILSVIFLLNSCKKGDAGPQGPAGQNGKTNVSSTTYTMTNWLYTSPYYYKDLAVPELTASNIDSSMVMVYFSTIGSNWFALPYTQYNSPINYFMGFVSRAGNVQVTWTYNSSLSAGSDPDTYYATTVKCKVVIIPPSAKKSHVNHNDYKEVKASYNLKD